MDRVILHADLNCFYASVEMLYNPSLRKVPLAVCGDIEDRHGIVLTKNLLAKKCHVQTGEAIWQAKQKCPNLVVVEPNYALYLYYAKKVKKVYEDYTDKIESFGIDEAWLDLTSCKILYPDPYQTALSIINRVYHELGLTLSVGISYNKIFAKLGSDLAGVNEAITIYPDEVKEKIWPLPVSSLLYVGRATTKKLALFDIYTIGDLANQEFPFLKRHLGKMGEVIGIFAKGLDTSEVSHLNEEPYIKSIGNSTTCPKDLMNYNDAKIVLMVLSESVAERLRAHGFYCQTVVIYLRTTDLEMCSHQMPLKEASDLSSTILKTALTILKNTYDFNKPLRSIGVRATNLITTKNHTQLDIFEEEEYNPQIKKLECAMDEIRRRFGHYAVARCSALEDNELSGFNPKEEHVIHPVAFFK